MTGRRPDAVAVPLISSGSSVACLRSLGNAGVRTIGLAETASAASAHSKHCHEVRRVPSSWSDLDGFTDELFDVAERSDVRTVVPLRESHIYLLAKHRDRLAREISTPWPSFETFQTVQDWLELAEVATAVDVTVPETAPADEWTHWDEQTVVKSRHSIHVDEDDVYDSDVQFFDSGGEPDVEEVVADFGHVPIAQEYVTGSRECGFFALFDSGEPVATFQHRRVRSHSYAGGPSVYRTAIDDPSLEAAGLRLLEALDWHGPAMVEFKYDPVDGEFYLMEINPRFWGSLALPVAAGVDFPKLYYELATGGVDEPAFDYETGVGCHLLIGELSYLYSILTDDYAFIEKPALLPELVAISRSVVTEPQFDYLALDDPRPFLCKLGALACDLPSLTRDLLAGPLTSDQSTDGESQRPSRIPALSWLR